MKKYNLQPRTVRVLILLSAITCALLIFVLRLIQLQVFQYNQWSQRSKKNHVSKRVLEMKRGSITDRNGVELAISVDTYSVFIFTRELKSATEAANLLATVLPFSREELLTKISGKSGYIPIYKNLEPNLATKLKKLSIPGVNLEKNYKRYYPQKNLASNIIGFTGTEKKGLEGLEYSYDKTLRGYSGLAVQESISLSESGPAKMRIVRPPMGGSNIRLTIDSFIQHTLETELAGLIKKYDPIDAQAIAMNPHTGEILGLACLPNYDLNNFRKSKPSERRNRPVVDVFEPGSCMKIFAVASAIENKKADHDTRYYCKGYGESNGRRIRCHGAHGLVDLNEAIAESCNAAMVEISKVLEKGQLYRTYKNLGFGEPTGIETPGEISGLLRPPSRWSDFSSASLCFGQELSTTGIQLVAAYSAIANGGKLFKPHIIKRIVSPDEDIKYDIKPTLVRKVFSPQLARWLRKMLMGVVETGTGKQVKLDDYTVGGKTSTAQKPNPKGGYFNEKVVVSFIGMAPAIDPKIVLLVAVNEPKGDERTLYGGKVAGPVFAKITDRILKHLKVPPDKSPTFAKHTAQKRSKAEIIKLPNKLTAKPIAIASTTTQTNSKIVPNLKGKSLKALIKAVNNMQLKGIYEGNGIVIKQKPKPGTAIPDSKIIRFTLSPDKFD